MAGSSSGRGWGRERVAGSLDAAHCGRRVSAGAVGMITATVIFILVVASLYRRKR